MEIASLLAENRDANTNPASLSKKSNRLSSKLKRTAGRVFEDVKETLNKPISSRRSSEAELMNGTPEKTANTPTAPATDGKGSSLKRKLSWRGLSSTLKHSLRKTFNLDQAAIAEQCEEDKRKVFGVEIEQLMIQERLANIPTAHTGLPNIVIECLNYLIPKHQQEEGLFRISGMQEEVQALKERVDSAAAIGQTVSFSDEPNCHNISGLLKLFFRELPSPIYPQVLHADLISAGKMENEAERKETLYQIAKQLPYSSYLILRKLTCALKDLSDHASVTKMTSANLSTVWSPNLLWDKKFESDANMYVQFSRDTNQVIQHIIEDAYYIFKDDIQVESHRPKRRSIFDMDNGVIERSPSGNIIEKNVEQSSSSASSSSMDISPCPSSSSAATNPDEVMQTSDKALQLPVFEDMITAASSKTSRKRPRSIWVGAPSCDLDDLVSASSSSSNMVTAMSQSHHQKSASEVSARRSRVSIKRESATLNAEFVEPLPKRRKIASISPLEDAIHEVATPPSGASATATPANATSTLPSTANNSTSGTPTPKKSLRASIRKSLRLSTFRGNRSTMNGLGHHEGSLAQVTLYYYSDSNQHSLALKKLLSTLHLIPQEIRNAENDPMTLEEFAFFAGTCKDIVVVFHEAKPHTISHKIADLNMSELNNYLVDAQTGKPRAPAIIVGSTLLVGFDKHLKDVFKYYMSKKA